MKDFNLVAYLKTNKLGAYGMLNENYTDLKPVNNPMGEAEDFGFDTDDDEGDDMTYRGGDTDDEDETPMTNASRMADLTDERALKQFKNAAEFIAGDLEDEGFDTIDIAEYLKQIIDELNVNLNEGKDKDKITVVIDYNTDDDDIEYVSNILKKEGIKAKVKAGLDMEEVEVTIKPADLAKAKKALSKNGLELQDANLNEGEEAASDKKEFDGLNIVALAQSGNDKDANIEAVEIYGDRIWLTYKIGKETERQAIMKTKFPATKGKAPIYVRFNLNGGNYDVSNISKVIYDTAGKLK